MNYEINYRALELCKNPSLVEVFGQKQAADLLRLVAAEVAESGERFRTGATLHFTLARTVSVEVCGVCKDGGRFDVGYITVCVSNAGKPTVVDVMQLLSAWHTVAWHTLTLSREECHVVAAEVNKVWMLRHEQQMRKRTMKRSD